MNIVLLDASTLGEVTSIEKFQHLGNFISYSNTAYAETIQRIAGAEIIITNKVVIDQAIMEQSPDLKLICVAATGMNNVDLEYAKQKGIQVKNVTGYSTDSVAQQTFAMILSLVNHVHYYTRYVQQGQYSKSKIFTLVDNPVYELKNKTLGIIGLGSIGRRVAEIASVFGMKIIYHSCSGVIRKEKYPSLALHELLSQSDIVTIHSPLNDKTKHLIKLHELKQMKNSAILINAGRGGIVKEEDLVEALNNKFIAAASLDVFEYEPLPVNSPLLKIHEPDQLLLFPHTAWSSVEAREALVNGILCNIENYLHQQ